MASNPYIKQPQVNNTDYALLYADILPGVTVAEAADGLRIYAEIAELQKRIDEKFAELARTAHKAVYGERRYMTVLKCRGRDDMTLNATAEALGISRNTANQHVARAKERFRCKTTTGALYVAMKERIIV